MSGSNALLDSLAHPAQVNLLADYQGAAQTANSIWQNRLWQAKQAAGQAQQGGVDADGNFQATTANRLLAQNPNAALAAGQTLESSQSVAGSQQEQAMKRAAFINQGLPGLMTLPDDKLHDGLVDMMNRGRAQGIGTPESNLKIMSTFSHEPAVLRQQLERARIAMQPPEQQQASIYGTRPEVHTGGDIQFPVVPSAASGQPAPTIPTTMSPEAAGGQVTWLDANGVQQYGTGAQYAIERGAGRVVGGAHMASEGPIPPGASTKDYTGNPLLGPLPGGGPLQMPQAGGGKSQALPGLTSTSGPQPQLLKVQQASVDHYSTDSRAAGGYQDRIYPLQQAAKALETAKTGEGSDVLQSIASRIQTLTPDALKNIVPNIRTPEEIAAYDEARKYLTMAQQNRPGADRSDAGLASAGDSSPSTHISPAAAKLLVQAQMGVERSKQAQLLEFNETHPQGTEGQYDRWLSGRSAKIDPRAFIADSQTVAQRKSYYDRLGDTEKKNYLDSYALAKKHGLLTLPNGP